MKSPNIKRKLCVTFIGMSGVGKTTVLHELGRVLKERGCNFAFWPWMLETDFLNHNKIKRHILPLLYAIKSVASLKVLGKFLFIFLKLNPLRLSATDRENYYDTIRVFLIQNFLMQRHKADIYLFDETALHSVFSRIDTNKIDRVMEDLVEAASWDNFITIFVFVSAPVSVAIDRLIFDRENRSKRAQEELKSNSKVRETYRKIFDNHMANEKKITDILKKMDNAFFIRIDTTRPLAENAKKIFKFLHDNFL